MRACRVRPERSGIFTEGDGGAIRSLRRVVSFELHHISRLSHNCVCLLRAFFGRTSCSQAKVQEISNHRRPIIRRWSFCFTNRRWIQRSSRTRTLYLRSVAAHIVECVNSVQWQAFWKRVAARPRTFRDSCKDCPGVEYHGLTPSEEKDTRIDKG